MIRNYGVSTDTYFMTDAHQIPRKGLDTVYLCYKRISWHYSFSNIPCCELEFCYEDGTHFPVKLMFVEEMDLEQLIRRYDDSVKIYRHRKMREKDLWLCPFQRLSAEEPFVRKETLEELSTLCDGNSFWRLSIKNKDRWDGNGTAWPGVGEWIRLLSVFYQKRPKDNRKSQRQFLRGHFPKGYS